MASRGQNAMQDSLHQDLEGLRRQRRVLLLTQMECWEDSDDYLGRTPVPKYRSATRYHSQE